jgi:hypothetical protein
MSVNWSTDGLNDYQLGCHKAHDDFKEQASKKGCNETLEWMLDWLGWAIHDPAISEPFQVGYRDSYLALKAEFGVQIKSILERCFKLPNGLNEHEKPLTDKEKADSLNPWYPSDTDFLTFPTFPASNPPKKGIDPSTLL